VYCGFPFSSRIDWNSAMLAGSLPSGFTQSYGAWSK